jgi:hypothetical protein
VIVNRSALSGLPTEHEHLDKFILHHAMTRIVSRFEAKVRRNLVCADVSLLDEFVRVG